MRGPFRALGIAALLCAFSVAAQPSDEEQAEIEAMIEQAGEIDPSADQPAWNAAFTRILDHARQFYPEDHPGIASIKYHLALGEANVGHFAETAAIIEAILPALETGGDDYRGTYLSSLNLLLVSHVRQGDLAAARAIGDRVLVARRELLALTPEDQDLIAGLVASLNNSAYILNADGQPRAALQYMAEAEELIDRMEAPSPAVLINLTNTPVYWADAGDADMALREGQRIVAKLERLLPPDHPSLANAYNSLSIRAAERSQFGEAERFSLRAIELALNAEAPDMAMVSTFRLGLAQTQLRQGKPQASLATVDEALVHLIEGYGEKGELTLYGQHVRASALRDLGRLDDAIATARKADADRAETMEPAHFRRIAGQELLAELLLESGKPAEAHAIQLAAQQARAAGDAIGLWEKLAGDVRLGAYAIRAGMGGIETVAAAHAQLVANRDAILAAGQPDAVQLEILGEAHDWALDAAMHAGDVQRAFAFAQDALATKADRAAQMAAFRQGLDAADAQLVRDYQNKAEAVRTLATSQIEQMADGATPEDLAAMGSAMAAARAGLAQAGQSIDPALFAASAPVDLATAQAALAPDDTLLIVHPMQLGLAVIVADREQTAMHVAPVSGQQVMALVSRMRGALTRDDVLMRGVLARPAAQAEPDFDFAPGAQIYEAIFAGAAGDLLKQKQHIRIAAGGALSRIPFAALAPMATSLDDAHWLVRDHSLSVVPSVGTLNRPARAASATSHRVVAVGAPVLNGESLSMLRSSRMLPAGSSVDDLPPLPEAFAELEAISKALGTQDGVLLAGEDARKARVLAELGQPAGVIAFATHGLLEGDISGLDEPALVLTPEEGRDGLLRASEVALLDMDAEWVILSACNTGGPDRPGAAGLSGLASAFLYAGARNLLVSHWEVADDVARSLTVPTVESFYRDGLDPAEGLRRAVIALIDESGDPRLQHPAYWAPFVYVGGS